MHRLTTDFQRLPDDDRQARCVEAEGEPLLAEILLAVELAEVRVRFESGMLMEAELSLVVTSPVKARPSEVAAKLKVEPAWRNGD